MNGTCYLKEFIPSNVIVGTLESGVDIIISLPIDSWHIRNLINQYTVQLSKVESNITTKAVRMIIVSKFIIISNLLFTRTIK